MRAPRTWSRIWTAPWAALAVMLALLPAMPILAAGETTDWEPVLRLQLKDNNSCELEKVLFAREMQLGGDTGLEGRLRGCCGIGQ